MDTDGSGTVSLEECQRAMRQEDADKMYREIERTIYRQAENAKEVEEMFKMIDADGSGEVDKAEFEAAFS
jgi:Ca2+-binding EF-hand superfamily protein